MKQRSQEWFEARIGKVTASKVADVIATIKTGESAARKNYRVQLVCERLTGKVADQFVNDHMMRGIELEPVARSVYEQKTGEFVQEVGFVLHHSVADAGASPDGLVGKDGMIEIKCPSALNHVETIMSGEMPSKYKPQVQWQMACCGKDWVDFVSYNQDMPENLQLFVTRVYRDNEYIAMLEESIVKFLEEVNQTVTKLEGN